MTNRKQPGGLWDILACIFILGLVLWWVALTLGDRPPSDGRVTIQFEGVSEMVYPFEHLPGVKEI